MRKAIELDKLDSDKYIFLGNVLNQQRSYSVQKEMLESYT